MKCIKCGTENLNNSTICSVCGSSLTNQQSTYQNLNVKQEDIIMDDDFEMIDEDDYKPQNNIEQTQTTQNINVSPINQQYQEQPKSIQQQQNNIEQTQTTQNINVPPINQQYQEQPRSIQQQQNNIEQPQTTQNINVSPINQQYQEQPKSIQQQQNNIEQPQTTQNINVLPINQQYQEQPRSIQQQQNNIEQPQTTQNIDVAPINQQYQEQQNIQDNIANEIENKENSITTIETNNTEEKKDIDTNNQIESASAQMLTIDDIKIDDKKTVSVEQPKEKNTKKIMMPLIITISVLVLIAIIVFIIPKLTSPSNNYKVNLSYNPDQPILIKEKTNNTVLFGYISPKTADAIIPTKYIDASLFHNKYALVSELDENKEIVKEIIDDSGKVAMTYSNATYFPKYNIWLIDGILYNSSLKQLSKDQMTIETKYKEHNFNGYFSWIDNDNNKAGIINTDGKITYTYDLCNDFENILLSISNNDSTIKEKYCIINLYSSTKSRYAIVNCNSGKTVYEYTQSQIVDKGDNIFEIRGQDDADTLIFVSNDKISYQITKPRSISDAYIRYDQDGYLMIKKSPSDSLMYFDIINNKETTKLSDISSRNIILNEYNGYEIKKCDNKLGVSKNSKDILDCNFDSIEMLDNNIYSYFSSNGKDYILASTNGKTHLIDLKTKKIEETFNTFNVYSTSSSEFLNYTDIDTKKEVIYSLITKKSKSFDDYYEIGSNYVVIKEDNKYNYYNNDFKLIYSTENK